MHGYHEYKILRFIFLCLEADRCFGLCATVQKMVTKLYNNKIVSLFFLFCLHECMEAMIPVQAVSKCVKMSNGNIIIRFSGKYQESGLKWHDDKPKKEYIQRHESLVEVTGQTYKKFSIYFRWPGCAQTHKQYYQYTTK